MTPFLFKYFSCPQWHIWKTYVLRFVRTALIPLVVSTLSCLEQVLSSQKGNAHSTSRYFQIIALDKEGLIDRSYLQNDSLLAQSLSSRSRFIISSPDVG
jgi:hypothetical protein